MNITNEGFSFHTMQMKKLVTNNEYKHIKNAFYVTMRTEHCKVYPDKINCIVSEQYQKRGILLKLKKTKDKFSYLVLRINPRFLIGECDYSKIFPYSRDNVFRIRDEINGILKCLGVDFTFTDMNLSRIDLCVNLEIDNNEVTDAYLRLLRKCRLPKGYERIIFTKENNNYKEKNLNSFTVENAISGLSIYNKTFQLLERNLLESLEDVPDGLLRVEVVLKREGIVETVKKYNDTNIKPSNIEMLILLVENCKIIMEKYLHEFYLSGNYFPYTIAKERIKRTSYQKEIKDRMLEILKKTSECSNMNEVISKLETDCNLTKYQIMKTIEKFDIININPITLKNDQSHLVFLPSIFEALNMNVL